MPEQEEQAASGDPLACPVPRQAWHVRQSHPTHPSHSLEERQRGEGAQRDTELQLDTALQFDVSMQRRTRVPHDIRNASQHHVVQYRIAALT